MSIELTDSEASIPEVVAWLREQGALDWYGVAWETRLGVSQRCEPGSGGPYGCHWYVISSDGSGE